MFLNRRRTELMLRLKEGGGGEVQRITGPAGREGGEHKKLREVRGREKETVKHRTDDKL